MPLNDPHVSSVTYRLLPSDTLEFYNPAPVIVDTSDFSGELADGALTLHPKSLFASDEEVRPLADALIRAWEIDAGLNFGPPEFVFEYKGAQLIDRNPSSATAAILISSTVLASASVRVKIPSPKYPLPPASFRMTPEVEAMWSRFKDYLQRKEPLLSMAYFCLTLLTKDGHQRATKRYNINIEVLKTLGKLTSERGDSFTARKVTPRTKPLSAAERAWVETTVKALIRHMAFGSEDPSKPLRMADLPRL